MLIFGVDRSAGPDETAAWSRTHPPDRRIILFDVLPLDGCRADGEPVEAEIYLPRPPT